MPRHLPTLRLRHSRTAGGRSVRAYGRLLADFEPLLPAEKKLIGACRIGDVAVIGSELPTEQTAENTVRSAFLRFLLLGGDERTPLHEYPVHLCGAYLLGKLDLWSAPVLRGVAGELCRFEQPLSLMDAKIEGGIFLQESAIPGLIADRARIAGPLFLRGAEVSGEVRLLGVRIGGNLDCTNAKLNCKGGTALSADSAAINGDVLLSGSFQTTGSVRLLSAHIDGDLMCEGAKLDGKGECALFADRAIIKGNVFFNKPFQATGEIRLLGTQIDGNLECEGAKLDGKEGRALSADGAVIRGSVFFKHPFQAIGTIRLTNAQIGRSLECLGAKLDGKQGRALSADGARIEGTLFFRELNPPASSVNLASASAARLVDDAASWGQNLVLDGFQYGQLTGGAPTNARMRLEWLDKQRSDHCGLKNAGQDFKPQPWRQLQKALRDMGHTEDARQVAVAFEDRLRKADLIGLTPAQMDLPFFGLMPDKLWNPIRSLIRILVRTLHGLFGVLTGYGHRPLKLLAWFLLVWLACGGFYAWTAQKGIFAPSSPAVFQKLNESCKQPLLNGNWYGCPAMPEEYTQFSPFAYSLDVILPVVDLHQRKDWGSLVPVPKEGFWDELFTFSLKHVTRLVIWLETLFGWAASLLLAAILSGLTKRRDD